MSIFKDCVNCGKQNIFDVDSKLADLCLHCGQPIGIKAHHQEEAREPETPEAITVKKTEETPPIYIGKVKVKNKGSYKWGKRCRECEFHYIHDEASWCSRKRCPKKCPRRLRPQYRPSPSEPLTGKKLKEIRPETKGKAAYSPFKGFPSLPEFNEAWTSDVKVAWLNSYEKSLALQTLGKIVNG